MSFFVTVSVFILIYRKLENEEKSAENWYDCLIPNCCKSCFTNFQCCDLKVPGFITGFQAKLKDAKISRTR